MIIRNLYDSHIHLLMTGEFLLQANLAEVRSESDLEKIINNSNLQRGDWIIGYGWDENKFDPDFNLNKKVLDRISTDKFIFLVRTDGHSSCVNSKVIDLLNYNNKENQKKFSDFIQLTEEGETTGILRESAHMKVYEYLPSYESTQIQKILKKSIQHFLSQGFTYVRDMTTRLQQWEAELDLYERGELNIFIEHNFVCENISDLDQTLTDIKRAQKQETDRLRVRGIKIFYDGSLGSRTAALSLPYADENNNQGSVLWEKKDVKDLIINSWRQSVDVSVHTIGDQAADDIVTIAKSVSASGLSGRLNLEHVQVLKSETIKAMKPLHVVCHMQPCHWLSDRLWLKERLGTLYTNTFSWEKLQRAGIPVQFGSDSPIESASLANNMRAIKESALHGIGKMTVNPLLFHCYNQIDQIESESHFDDDYKVKSVIFNKKTVYSVNEDRS